MEILPPNGRSFHHEVNKCLHLCDDNAKQKRAIMRFVPMSYNMTEQRCQEISSILQATSFGMKLRKSS